MTTLAYDADGTSTVTDARGNAHAYTFQTQFSLVKPAALTGAPVQSSGGQAFTYDANGFIASRTDWNGNVTTYTHDTRGDETSRTEASGTALARTITRYGIRPSICRRRSRSRAALRSQPRHDIDLRPRERHDAEEDLAAGSLGRTWTYSYNAAGQPKTVTDPNGNVTTLGYDARAGLAK